MKNKVLYCSIFLFLFGIIMFLSSLLIIAHEILIINKSLNKMRENIKVRDTVYHSLSKLYFICENKKQEKWMNENKYYSKSNIELPNNYHKKNNKK